MSGTAANILSLLRVANDAIQLRAIVYVCKTEKWGAFSCGCLLSSESESRREKR